MQVDAFADTMYHLNNPVAQNLFKIHIPMENINAIFTSSTCTLFK